MDFGRDPTDLWNPHNLSRKIIAVRSQAGYDPIPATTLSHRLLLALAELSCIDRQVSSSQIEILKLGYL